MHTALFVAAVIFITLGGLLSFANWVSVIASYRLHRFVSAIPLVGGLLLGIGLCLIRTTRRYAWLAIPADYGTIVTLICLPIMLGNEWRTSKFNLVSTYTGRKDDVTITLRLYRRNIFVLDQDFDPPRGTPGLGHTGCRGIWSHKGAALTLSRKQAVAEYELLAGGEKMYLTPVKNEAVDDQDKILMEDGVDLFLSA